VAFDFPAAPTVGELYPNPEQSGVPQYVWDGSAWQSAPGSGQSTFVERAGDTMLGHLALVENPSDPDAVRKDYVDNAIATNVPPPPDLSGYLPLTGGTMSGGLHFGSAAVEGVDLSRHLDLYGGSFGISVISGTLNMVAGSVASLQATPQGAAINGTGTVNGPLTVNGVTNIYGNITAHGSQVYASTLRADGAITGGDITATGNFWTGATYYFRGNGGIYLTHDGSNFSFGGGAVYTNNNLFSGGVYGSYLNSSGNLDTGGDIGCGNTCRAGWGFYTNNAGNGNPWIVSFFGGNPSWGAIYGQALHYPGVWAGMNFDIGGNGTVSFRGGGLAYKSGGQIYWDGSSDARIKRVLGDYMQGLDAVCALNPVRYVYKGNETHIAPSHFSDSLLAEGAKKPENYEEIQKTPLAAPYGNSPNYVCARDLTEYVGLVAQQAETAMPELIRLEKGFIDGVEVDDIRQVNYTPLMFAMVNAFKEMKERIEALEALVAAK
jgi:hypothetical protein